MLPNFSFMQDDLAVWQNKLGIGVYDWTLKLGYSHAIQDISVNIMCVDLLFHYFFIKIKSIMLPSVSFTQANVDTR